MLSEQRLHPDFQTTLPDTDYFFLGSGKIQAAIQWSRNKDATPLGFILSRPDQFARKWGSHLFHPELGLERTMVTVIIDGVRYKPSHDSLQVSWSEHQGVPNIFARWKAGEHEVVESFWTSPDTGALIRWVWIKDCNEKQVEIETSLYANPSLLSSFGSSESLLYAAGYSVIYLAARVKASINERFMTIIPEPFLSADKGAHLIYAEGGVKGLNIEEMFTAESAYWHKTSCIIPDTGKEIAQTFDAAKNGLRAVIASSGRFEASIWQYGMEWGRDAARVAEGLIYSGQFELAKKVLTNILTALSNADGMVAEASRFRGGKQSELDSNGLVLSAIHTYYEWTGDTEFVKAHWPRISAIADYLLKEEFVDEATGLFKASRDIWERNEAMGIEEGFDIAHETFAISGLFDAALLAEYIGETEQNILWKAAAEKAQQSFLSHPSHSLIENDRIIKRRLLNGTRQTELHLNKNKESEEFFAKFAPSTMPLADSGKHLLEPDISQLFPIIFGFVDSNSDVTKNTINDVAKLWSQAWEGGGIGRYDISGEPDSPGPWSLATIFFAQAAIQCGEKEWADKALNWLHEKAGAGGAFFEFYGERPTPPLPPVGILVWAWAEYVILIVRDVLGAHIKDGKLLFNPTAGLSGHIRFRDSIVDVTKNAS